MLFKISATGNQSLGEFRIYQDGCEHQPNLPPAVRFGGSPFAYQPNPEAVYKNVCPYYQLPFAVGVGTNVSHEITEYTFWSQYTLYEAFYADNAQLFPAYIGATEKEIVTPLQGRSIKPFIRVENNNGIAFYGYAEVSFFASKAKYYKYVEGENSLPIPVKPNYKSLVKGYYLDVRKLPKSQPIIPAKTQQVKIGYYRESTSDPRLAIEWMHYTLDLVKRVPYFLPIEYPVLGTFYCDDDAIGSQIRNLHSDSDYYPYAYLFDESLPSIFNDWNALYQAKLNQPLNIPDLGAGTTIENISYFYYEQISRTLRAMGGNNNVWNNRDTPTDDINLDLTHPFWIVDNDRSYDWWFAPQSDQSYGTVTMHNPKIDEIRDALNAGYYSKNPTTGEARVANLGHLVENIAALFGYRPEPDGTLSHDKEKAKVRTVISKDNPVDPSKVGVNSFGEQGMVVRRLNNAFTGKEITANECVLVRDLPQLLAEYQDQINLALGLQESSAISVETQNGTAKYENQLAVLTELLNLSISNHDMIRSALVSVMVAQGKTSEIIAGMGLPSVTKTIPVEIDGKISDLPYQGIAAHRSISQEIAVCTQNVGIVAGQLL
jgi:hypothetical protein